MRLTVAVNEFGESLTNYPGCERNDTWETKVGSVVVHQTCSGFVDRTQVSVGYFAYHCRRCSLRVHLPISMWEATWEEMAKHFTWLLERRA